MNPPAGMIVHVYGCMDADVAAGHEYVAHVFGPSTNLRTGKTKMIMLPATEFASEPMVAADRLIAFLNDEIAKEEARKERGRLLGQSRRSAA